MKIYYSPEVETARKNNLPIVALETAVLTHGLPIPQNIELSLALEDEVRSIGAVPATIGLLEGLLHIGLTLEEVDHLGRAEHGTRKISRRDFGIAMARKENGGTTVAATMIAAHMAGIKVFSTGGIGGVHRNAPMDVSADLIELGRTPLIVVCSGAKAILDLPFTLEVLETQGVPVVGYQTDELPGFYSVSSGLQVNVRIERPEEAAEIARAQWDAGLTNAVLVVVPPPAEVAVPREKIERVIQQAVQEAEAKNIHGSKVTPFLLERVSQLSGGESMVANLALLRNNARVAAQIAKAF
jgi:pseudouridine-5'-phosphate glycosidase